MKKFASLLLCLMLLMSVAAAEIPAEKISQTVNIRAAYASTVPEIDGEIDPIWYTTDAVTTEYDYTPDIGQAYGVARVLWTEDALYLLAVVYDYTMDGMQPNSTANGANFWVSETNGITNEYTLPGDWHIFCNMHGNFNYYTGNAEALEKGVAATSIHADEEVPYYVVELKMPLLTEGLKLEAGKTMGFLLSVDDDADGDGARDCVCSWSPFGLFYVDVSSLPNMELVMEIPAEAAAE